MRLSRHATDNRCVQINSDDEGKVGEDKKLKVKMARKPGLHVKKEGPALERAFQREGNGRNLGPNGWEEKFSLEFGLERDA